eukprot:gene15600-18534_t
MLVGNVVVHATPAYCDVLKQSLMFYKANRAGRLPDNDIPWRGDTCLGDVSNGVDLSGGYFDAGDHVKFGLPMSYSIGMLAWGYIESSNKIAGCGLTNLYLDVIKYGTDWLIAAHTAPNEFVGQIGDGDLDHGFWGPPEMMTMDRPIYKLTTTAPGTEVAMDAAAALAAASIIWSGSAYGDQCLDHAKQLYSFGETYKGTYVNSIPKVENFYNSFSGYKDELLWGAIWMYKATRDPGYLSKANLYFNDLYVSLEHSWDNVSPGGAILLYQETRDAKVKSAIDDFVRKWMPGGEVQYTPGGLAWLREWGPARYAATSAFLAKIYAGSADHVNFAKSQLDYLLGNNPNGQSFVVGVGPKHPINPHHRAAHHSTDGQIDNPVNNVYILYGALVGGPLADDSYTDDRHDFKSNEVATDYNAGFTGLLAAFCEGSVTEPPTQPPATQPPTEQPSSTPTDSESSDIPIVPTTSSSSHSSSEDTKSESSEDTKSESSEDPTKEKPTTGVTQPPKATPEPTEQGTTTGDSTGARDIISWAIILCTLCKQPLVYQYFAMIQAHLVD